MRRAVIRGDSQELPDFFDGFVQSPLVAERNHDQAAALRLTRVEFEPPASVPDGLVELAESQVEFGEAGLDSRVAGIEFDNAIKLAPGRRVFVSGHEDHAQIQAGGRVVVFGRQCRAKVGGRFVELGIALQHAAEQELCLAEIGRQLDGLP